MACALMERIGTFPNSLVLGATSQIQGYTLHLAALEQRLLWLSPQGDTLLSG